MANFPLDKPGFIQLTTENLLQGTLEVTFMFKTAQKRGILLYMTDADQFYYVTLSMLDGALELRCVIFLHYVHVRT